MDMFLFVSPSSTKEQYVRPSEQGLKDKGSKTFPQKGLGLLLATHPPRFSDFFTAL